MLQNSLRRKKLFCCEDLILASSDFLQEGTENNVCLDYEGVIRQTVLNLYSVVIISDVNDHSPVLEQQTPSLHVQRQDSKIIINDQFLHLCASAKMLS